MMTQETLRPFRGRRKDVGRRANPSHQSTSDWEARLFRKGKGRKPSWSFLGRMTDALMENRHRLLADFQVTQATGTAERVAGPVLLD